MVTIEKVLGRIQKAVTIDEASSAIPDARVDKEVAALTVAHRDSAVAAMFKDFDLKTEIAKALEVGEFKFYDPDMAQLELAFSDDEDDESDEDDEDEDDDSDAEEDEDDSGDDTVTDKGDGNGVVADEPKKRRQIRELNIFADGEAMKTAQKLYFSYISNSDAGAFTTFLKDLDALMTEYREDSKSPINLNPEEEQQEQEKDNNEPEEPEEEDDEYSGLSEGAMRAILRRKKEKKRLKKRLKNSDD